MTTEAGNKKHRNPLVRHAQRIGSLLFAYLAITKLMAMASGGVGILLQTLLDKYSEALQAALGWATPLLEIMLRFAARHFPSVDLTLSGLWHDIFVVFGIAVAADVYADKQSHRPRSAVAVGLLGFVISLVASVLGDAFGDDRLPSMLSAGAAIGGYIVYSISKCTFQALLNPQEDLGRWGTWVNFMYRAPFAEILIGIAAMMGGKLLDEQGQYAAWLIAFLCFIFLLGMKSLIQAEMFAYQKALRAKEKPQFFTLRTSRFGRDIVLVLLASAVTVALNSP